MSWYWICHYKYGGTPLIRALKLTHLTRQDTFECPKLLSCLRIQPLKSWQPQLVTVLGRCVFHCIYEHNIWESKMMSWLSIIKISSLILPGSPSTMCAQYDLWLNVEIVEGHTVKGHVACEEEGEPGNKARVLVNWPGQVGDAAVVHVGEVGKRCNLLSIIHQYCIKTGHCIHHPVWKTGNGGWENGNVLIWYVHCSSVVAYLNKPPSFSGSKRVHLHKTLISYDIIITDHVMCVAYHMINMWSIHLLNPVIQRVEDRISPQLLPFQAQADTQQVYEKKKETGVYIHEQRKIWWGWTRQWYTTQALPIIEDLSVNKMHLAIRFVYITTPEIGTLH